MNPNDWSWLKELKVGDPVLMVRPGGRYREGSTETVTVVKVGRARIIVDDGTGRWNSEKVFRLTRQPGNQFPATVGHQEGDRGNYLSLPSIEKAKERRRELDEKLRKLGGHGFAMFVGTYDIETARKVYELLQRED